MYMTCLSFSGFAHIFLLTVSFHYLYQPRLVGLGSALPLLGLRYTLTRVDSTEPSLGWAVTEGWQYLTLSLGFPVDHPVAPGQQYKV